MNQHTQPTDAETTIACAVDKSCANSGCGCRPTPGATGQRRGVAAAMLSALCVLGCLAAPVAIGGFAAVGGALAGEAWLIVAGLVVAGAVAIFVKRRSGGSIC